MAGNDATSRHAFTRWNAKAVLDAPTLKACAGVLPVTVGTVAPLALGFQINTKTLDGWLPTGKSPTLSVSNYSRS